jgi:hypothetical protein
MLGGAVGLVTNIGQDNYLDKVITTASDNIIQMGLENLNEGFKEHTMPIYSTKAFQDKNMLEKMASLDAAFWGTDFVDTLAFTISSFVPGGVMSKAKVGTKALSGLSRNKRVANFLKLNRSVDDGLLKMTPNVKKAVDRMDYAATVGTSAYIESMFEAKDIRDSILSDPELINKFSDKELKEYAAEAAKNTFLMNMGTLLLTNSVEVGTLFNRNALSLKRASRKHAGSIFDDKVVRNAKTGDYEIYKGDWAKNIENPN